eukprot:1146070-Pelagomonas_calceolata.AAC.4
MHALARTRAHTYAHLQARTSARAHTHIHAHVNTGQLPLGAALPLPQKGVQADSTMLVGNTPLTDSAEKYRSTAIKMLHSFASRIAEPSCCLLSQIGSGDAQGSFLAPGVGSRPWSGCLACGNCVRDQKGAWGKCSSAQCVVFRCRMLVCGESARVPKRLSRASAPAPELRFAVCFPLTR